MGMSLDFQVRTGRGLASPNLRASLLLRKIPVAYP